MALRVIPVWALLVLPAAVGLIFLVVRAGLAPDAAITAMGIIAGLALGPAMLWRHGLHVLEKIQQSTRTPAAPLPSIPTLIWPGLREIAQGSARLERQYRTASAALHALRQRDEDVLGILPDPILVLGADRRLLRANRAAHALFGQDLAAFLRHPALAAALDAARTSGAVAAADIRLTIPVPRELRAQVVPLDGHLATGSLAHDGGVLILCVDRSAEQAMARMHADFVANASHELRTPLTALIGFIDTLRGPAADDPAAQARFLAIMAEQGARMARLIDDLLSLSRLEMTEHQLPVAQVAVAPLLERVVAGIGTILAGRGMRVEKDFAATLPTVTGDADQLTQIAQNLLDNAVKYGRDNGTIRIAARLAETDRGWPPVPGLVISVTDDGIGIKREHLPRLTERFYRVDAGRSPAMGGTGLGLAIVKHIVNRHRGDMRIESVEGEGTTVSIWLPCGAAATGTSMNGHGEESPS